MIGAVLSVGTVIAVAPGTFLAIVVASAVAATLSTVVKFRSVVVPTVVLELVFGIWLGPHVVGLHTTPFIDFFADLGLGMLFFFAGYEIDLRRISGVPLRLGVAGWTMSLVIAYALGGLLAATGLVLSLLYTGSALATTAVGMLIPILSDAGELVTRLGTYVLAAGAVGEFGPVLLLTLVLSAEGTVHNALVLIAFVAIVVAVAILALRSSERTLPLFSRTLETSAQLAVRWIVVLVFALAFLAYKLGLDLLLGGFAAGVITRQLLYESELPAFDSKLSALGFGVFIPFFFIVSGMHLDVSALFASGSGAEKLVVFLLLFLVVRGTPALVLYRDTLERHERIALAFLSATQLPMVVAITDLAVTSGHMRDSTAAALVAAAAISTLIYPILGLEANRRGLRSLQPAATAPEPPPESVITPNPPGG